MPSYRKLLKRCRRAPHPTGVESVDVPTRPHMLGGDASTVPFRAASGQLLSVDLGPLTHVWLLLVPKPAAEVDQGCRQGRAGGLAVQVPHRQGKRSAPG